MESFTDFVTYAEVLLFLCSVAGACVQASAMSTCDVSGQRIDCCRTFYEVFDVSFIAREKYGKRSEPAGGRFLLIDCFENL